MRHLRALAEAGLTTVHLLPFNDIATIEEDRSRHLDPGPLDHLPPDSEEQQRRVGAVRDRDGFNWGYDPLHYLAPEGSYAVEDRTREFRAMVRALNGIGLRVVLDVVFNHTPAGDSLPGPVVPGYYHRLTPDRRDLDSTCCANTATEHRMMEKLMLDSLEHWVRAYRVDGFRFDLMGHHTKANLLAARGAARPDLHLYGEGWSFGEVADDALFVAASQNNMAGTGIGTFNDVLRDAVRGGGPHDADPRPGLRDRRPERPGRACNSALAGHLLPRRLRRAARRRDRLRRRPRQRDAVRRARVQAPARDEHGRPRADEHARAGHGHAQPEPVLLARGRRAAALEVAGPQLL